ncbi:MAG: hypothetical protein ACK5M1_14650 [Xanthomarina gelatinilytica]|uniref:hypothetical protein n=1 Tax=Xanthomarina gelatinilytica TaxID=1137281 RepID=UPI003A85716A
MFSFKKQKPFNINEVKNLTDIDFNSLFTIVSDGSFLSFIINDWGLDPKYYYGGNLEKTNPQLYQNIVSGKFFSEFKDHIHQNYVKEVQFLFTQFNEPEIELDYFNDRLILFKNTIQKNKQEQNITSFSKSYINEVSQQLTNLRNSITLQQSKTQPISLSSIKKTVFGKNFEFIGLLYENLTAKEFLNDIETSIDDFEKHFYVDEKPKSKINLHGENSADFKLLLESLKPFFKEEYQKSIFFNQFWSDRFLFHTKDKRNNPNKNKERIIKMRSSKRIPIKRGAIKEIVKNLNAHKL